MSSGVLLLVDVVWSGVEESLRALLLESAGEEEACARTAQSIEVMRSVRVVVRPPGGDGEVLAGLDSLYFFSLGYDRSWLLSSIGVGDTTAREVFMLFVSGPAAVGVWREVTAARDLE